MDWVSFCKSFFECGIATCESLKVFVVKSKITSDDYKNITGVDYVA